MTWRALSARPYRRRGHRLVRRRGEHAQAALKHVSLSQQVTPRVEVNSQRVAVAEIDGGGGVEAGGGGVTANESPRRLRVNIEADGSGHRGGGPGVRGIRAQLKIKNNICKRLIIIQLQALNQARSIQGEPGSNLGPTWGQPGVNLG